MSIQVSLYDDSVLEFPDGTSDEVINRAAKRETTKLRVAELKYRNPAEYSPESKQYQDQYGSVSGNSFLENSAIGAGKLFTDIGLGAKQMVGAAPPEAAAEKQATDAAIMNTAGGNFGYAGGALAATVPVAMGLGATVPGAAMAAGLFGAFQPSGSVSDRYLRTARDAGYAALGQYGFNRLLPRVGSYTGREQLGSVGVGADGAGIPAGNRTYVPEGFTPARQVSRPTNQAAATANSQATGVGTSEASISANPTARVSTRTEPSFGQVGDDPSAGLSSTQDRVLKTAESLGFRVTPGTKSGSKVLQQMEAKMESQPWSSGRFFAIKDANQKNGNRIAAESIGEKGEVVDDRILRSAADRIGRVYTRVADERVRTVDPEKFLSELSSIEEEWSGLLANNGAVSDHPLVNQLLTQVANGKVTGRVAQQLSSKLGKAIKTQMKTQGGDRELGLALIKVKDLTDDILAQGLDGDTAGLFNTARRQYRTLMMIEAPNVTNTANGNVSLANLANSLARVDKNGYMRGGNQTDLYNAARFAQAFRPLVGDSGTATRSPFGTTLTDVAIGVPVNLATRAYTSNVATAAAGAIGKSSVSKATAPARAGANSALAKAGSRAYPYLYPGTVNALIGDK